MNPNGPEQTSTEELIKEGAGLMSCNTAGHQGAEEEIQHVPFYLLHRTFKSLQLHHFKAVYYIKTTNTGLNIGSTLQS